MDTVETEVAATSTWERVNKVHHNKNVNQHLKRKLQSFIG